MKSTRIIVLLAALSGLGVSGCYTIPKPGEKVVEAEEHWTCPHEGGDFKHAGKCPNSWCGLDLVQKK